jgi:DNA-binding transcriptional ArsR family regulator
MDVGSALAGPARLLADPARARILGTLMDGRPRTATELAHRAGVSPQTASSHLTKLVEARWLAVEARGRFRHYRLAGPKVGQAIEALLVLGGEGSASRGHRPPDTAPLRLARTCYDHLAGLLGVGLTDMLVARKFLRPVGRDFRVSPGGERFLRKVGVNVDKARAQRRGFARQCTDWTERRPHLAGALGAALADRWLALGWVRRVPGNRRLVVTPRGRRALTLWLGRPLPVPA